MVSKKEMIENKALIYVLSFAWGGRYAKSDSAAIVLLGIGGNNHPPIAFYQFLHEFVICADPGI